MIHIVWENLIILLIIFLLIIGVPISVLVWLVKGRNAGGSKIKELEQRIEKLESEKKHDC